MPKTNQSEFSGNKNEGIGLLQIFLTALITSIFTLASSYFLMFSQLEKEQEYWMNRMRTERYQELMDRQINLLEEINSGLLQSEILVKDYKLESASFMSNLEFIKQNPGVKLDSDVEALAKKAFEYHLHLYKLASKLQMAELYFSNKVDSLIAPLGKALEENYNNELALKDSLAFSWEDPIKYFFNRDFETVQQLADVRIKLITAMREDIAKIANSIYTD